MLSLIFIVAFVVCLAMAAAAIQISHSFTSTYSSSFHRHYFYYLVAFYLFSVYGVWGQILARGLLRSLDAGTGVVEVVLSFLSVMGVPVLFVSWLMLINMAYSMFGSSATQRWIPLHAVVFLLFILGAWLSFAASPGQAGIFDLDLRYIVLLTIIGFELIYFAVFLLIVHRQRSGRPDGASERLWRFAVLLTGAFVLRSALLPSAYLHPLGALVVLVYCGSNLVPLFYLRAENDRIFAPVGAHTTNVQSMTRIVERYGITKRERQIVEQICAGKTNQQIADALFISLQTVKDHTHRIYSKIGIKSRLQLVQKVNQ